MWSRKRRSTSVLAPTNMARFYAPDGTTLIDAAAWTVHSPTTYGQCPDGSGAFQVSTTVTKGAANDCRILIAINEIESDGGTPGDWVELFNPGPGPANLTGFFLKDANDLVAYPLPGVIVPANGYLVLEQAAVGFSLDGADAVRLFRPDGTLADFHQWAAHAATTYGRCPNGAGPFIPTLGSTKGATNNCFVPVTTVHINEVESNGGVPGDWFELVNTGATTVDLSGWQMLDNDDTHAVYVFPAGTTVRPGRLPGDRGGRIRIRPRHHRQRARVRSLPARCIEAFSVGPARGHDLRPLSERRRRLPRSRRLSRRAPPTTAACGPHQRGRVERRRPRRLGRALQRRARAGRHVGWLRRQ